jgi:adenylate cyclase, class 2
MQNLELKSVYPNHKFARAQAAVLGASFSGTLVQTDTYFSVKHGRLKLRRNEFYPPHAKTGRVSYELIFYKRANMRREKSSHYTILPVADGEATRQFLAASLGVITTVQKTRELFLNENLRIHLDTVKSLGKFLEFELVISKSFPAARCRKQMAALKHAFRINAAALIRYSYSDLMMQKKTKNRTPTRKK